MMEIAKHRPRPLTGANLKIIELAARPCGVSCRQVAEACAIPLPGAASALYSSERAHRVIKAVHLGDKLKKAHYFTDRRMMAEWLAGPSPTLEPMSPVLVAIGQRIKSSAKQPGPQLLRERAPQGHTWRPDAHTAGASKMAAKKASAALPPTAVGASPPLGAGYRYFVDPATVQGPLMAEWRKLRGQA